MVIKCENKEKMFAVLGKLASETEVKWITGDDIEAEKFRIKAFPLWLIIDKDNRLAWEDESCEVPFDEDTFSADEFLSLYTTETEDDPVNHPSHYTQGKVECIDAMEQVFGRDAVISFAMLNCFKYLWRRNDKGNEEQDIQKSLWYFDKFKELINR